MGYSIKELGALGEKYAADYLAEQGYRILERNFRYGKMGEVDIIAQSADTVVFVEVRTRTSTFVTPEETITYGKRKKVARLAQVYFDIKNLKGVYGRIDVISVCIAGDDYTIEHLEDAIRPGQRY